MGMGMGMGTGIPDVNVSSLNAAALQPQDSQPTIFPSSSSSSITAELSFPEKIESSFLTANAFILPSSTSSCLEMVSFMSVSYTSLKDLLPSSPPSSCQSWDEIPIKNRLVQKAATFYLYPMSSSREPIDQGFLSWLGINCSFHCRSNSLCGCGCFEFVNKMISETFQRLFFGANWSRQNVELGQREAGEEGNNTSGDS